MEETITKLDEVNTKINQANGRLLMHRNIKEIDEAMKIIMDAGAMVDELINELS